MSDVQPGLVLITGGVRAGKTRFAERLAGRHGARVLYLATAEAGDGEMRARIARHRAERPPGWRTAEAPLDPVAALEAAAPADAVLFDCLTLWASNLLLAAPLGEPPSPGPSAAEARAGAALDGLLAWQAARRTPLFIVSNEVGWGVTPAYPLGRLYQDVLGRLNQRVAARAEHVYLVVAGLALDLRAAGAAPIDLPPPLAYHD